MQSITVTVTARQDIAAVMAAAYADGNPDPQAWLQSVIDRACFSYRDQFRTDAIPTAAFIRRIPPAAYAAILGAAEQVPELAAYLARLDAEPLVWLGSAETQAGVAALVGLGLLTQAEADALLAYPLPELPA
jgi:hypothetical protein